MVCFPIKQQFVRLLAFNFYFYDTIRFSTMILKMYCNIKSNEWITLEFVEILRKKIHIERKQARSRLVLEVNWENIVSFVV